MTKPPNELAIDFVRKLLEDELWSAAYHQWQLPLAHAKVAMCQDLLERARVIPTEVIDGAEDEPDTFEKVEDMAGYMLGSYRWHVGYHEGQIRAAHNKLGLIKLILARGNYTEIDIAECEAAAHKRLRERQGDEE